MEPKVTTMLLKVDLECDCCYKKVKRLCCKFPQIRNQVFDEKNNTVTITVVCCSPEKIRDKLCKKGGKTIKSIQIIEPTKPKPPAPEKPKPAPEQPKPLPPPPEKPKQPEPEKPKGPPPQPKKDGGCKPAEPAPPKPAPEPKPAPAPKPAPPPEQPKQSQCMPTPVQGYPPVYPVPVCCGPCYSGQTGGPCYHQGYYGGGGMVPPPPPQPAVCDPYSYGGGAYRTGYYHSSCGECFSDENPHGCSIM